jgi:hypothetical protein
MMAEVLRALGFICSCADDESILDDKRFISFRQKDHLANCQTISRILQLSSDMHETLAIHVQSQPHTSWLPYDIIIVSRKSGSCRWQREISFSIDGAKVHRRPPEQEYSSTRWYTSGSLVGDTGSRSAAITTTFF